MKWDTNLYDGNHGFVSKYGEALVDLLAPKAGERILDIGSGTGDLAHLIAQQGAVVKGIDNSPDMVEAAGKKYPLIPFELKSAADFRFGEPFDAVFSNATLHWVLDYEAAIKCTHQALKPGGRFVAEFGGKGNVANILHALRLQLRERGYTREADQTVWYFPSLSEYTGLLEQNGFRVVLAAHFDRETPLKTGDGIRNWLQMFGKPYLPDIDSAHVASIIQGVEDQIRATNYKDGNWYADYVRLRIEAIKQ